MSSISKQAGQQQKNEFQLNSQRNTGPWSPNENLLYVIFLQKNKHIFNSKKQRKYF